MTAKTKKKKTKTRAKKVIKKVTVKKKTKKKTRKPEHYLLQVRLDPAFVPLLKKVGLDRGIEAIATTARVLLTEQVYSALHLKIAP